MAAIVTGATHKTDSAGRPKILLPGSWNSVGVADTAGGKTAAGIPDSVLESSKVKSWDGVGAVEPIVPLS
jgi:hypothetical protein